VPFLSFVRPDDRANAKKQFRGSIQGKTVTGFETRFRCPDGSSKQNAEAVHDAAHSLKGPCLKIGANELTSVSGTLPQTRLAAAISY
jgi:hypothetical protein